MRPYFFFFNDTATTEIYTLSLHDALPISFACCQRLVAFSQLDEVTLLLASYTVAIQSLANRIQQVLILKRRSEEHTSELQSQSNLVCRLLLEKKKNQQRVHAHDATISSAH